MIRDARALRWKWIPICLAVCSLGAVALAQSAMAQDNEKPAGSKKAENKDQPISFWMQRKLEYSQNILDGLATDDLDKVLKNAQSMRNLSTIEGFVRRQTPGYTAQLKMFEESTDEMIRQAKRDNLDGAALAFTQLTVTCVNCHKRLREDK
jgi:hypothetical protein